MGKHDIATLAQTGAVGRGEVIRGEPGTIWVRIDGDPLACDVLGGAPGGSGALRPGEPVLVVRPGEGETRGCVLGRIERHRPAASGAVEAGVRRISARTIVVEAGERLELRVGDSSILITEDGRVVIQGRNVVSRAKALNRIRGGAVSIN